MAMISPSATTGNKACCWICLEEGSDDHGQPLTRNCACRGDSGWAHVACLARFAKVKTDGMSTDDYMEMITGSKGTPWSVCHTCKQEYHGDVATSLAKEWVDSVAGLDDASPHRIAAMLNLAVTLLRNRAFDVTIKKYEDLRDTLHSNKQDIDPMLWAHAEFICLAMLTHAYSSLGNKEKGREYAEKFKFFNKSMDVSHTDVLQDVLDLVTGQRASDQDQGGDTIRVSTYIYNHAVQTDGKDSPSAITSAASVAYAMEKARKFEESYHWLKDAHDRAKRVFGKQNPEYIYIKRKYLAVGSKCEHRKGTLVLNNSKLSEKEVTILRATKDGKKYIVDIKSEAGLSEKVKITPSQLIFAADTPVTIDSEDRILYIDSFDKKTNSYKVFAICGANDDENAYIS